MPRVPAACSSQSPETGEVFTAISPHTVKTKKLGGERLRMNSTLNPAAAKRWRRGRAAVPPCFPGKSLPTAAPTTSNPRPSNGDSLSPPSTA